MKRDILVLGHEEDNKCLPNYKFGRKIEKDDNIWINLDLTRTESEAAFKKW